MSTHSANSNSNSEVNMIADDEVQQANSQENVSDASPPEDESVVAELHWQCTDKLGTPLKTLKWLSKMFIGPLYVIVVIAVAASVQNGTETDTTEAALNETTCGDLVSTEPLPSSILVLLSLIPFVCVIQGVLMYELSSRYVAPFTLAMASMLSIWFFVESYPGGRIVAAGQISLTIVERVIWTISEYAFNVFSAFVLLRALQLWGVVESMREEFDVLADDPQRKILITLFCFAILVAVVAPGGSNFLIAGVIIIQMNILNLPEGDEKDDKDARIAAICLFGNGLTSAFNLVGVAIIALAADIVPLIDRGGVGAPCGPSEDYICAEKQIGLYFSLQFLPFCVATPFIMLWLYGEKVKKRNVVLCFLIGVVYGGVQLFTAAVLGPQLPCLTAAGASLLTFVAYTHMTGGKSDTSPEDEAEKGESAASESGISGAADRAWQRYRFTLPFLVLIALLMATSIPDTSALDDYPALSWKLFQVGTDCITWTRQWRWPVHSGLMVLFCASVTPFLVPRREVVEKDKLHLDAKSDLAHGKHPDMRSASLAVRALIRMKHLSREHGKSFWTHYRETMWRAFADGFGEALPVTVSIASYAAISKVMSSSGMTQSIVAAIVSGLESVPWLYPAIVPVIGMLGSGLTGSTTTSNFLFSRLHIETGLRLGLITTESLASPYRFAGAQVLGATAGEIIAPMNAVFSVLIIENRRTDGYLIRLLLPTFGFWLIACMGVSALSILV